MSHPLVSVVIPTFNRVNSVRAAVDSALAQTLREIEVLVVDDASEDQTVATVEAIDDPRVRVVRRERNGGTSAARNSGIRASNSAFVAFLDSDDTWMPTKLERQLKTLDAAAANVAVSCTGVEMHLMDHGVVQIQYLDDTRDWSRRLAMGCDLSPGTTQLTRREVFGRVGPLDEGLQRFEDWDWLLRYSRQAGIACVREPQARVYNRRARLGDVVARAAEQFIAKHQEEFAKLQPADCRRARADLWLQVTGTYAFEGKLREALPSIKAAMRERPVHTLGRLATGAGAVLRGRIAARWRKSY